MNALSASDLLARGTAYKGGLKLNANLRWRKDEIEAMRLLAEAGIGLSKVADILGRPESSIAWRASDAGLLVPPEWKSVIVPKKRNIKVREAVLPELPKRLWEQPKKIHTQRDGEICNFYNQGLTVREIGAKFSMSYQNVSRILSLHGIERRPNKFQRRVLNFDGKGLNWRDSAKDMLLSLLRAAGRGPTEILRLKETEAYSIFLGARYPHTAGSPVCPKCGASDANPTFRNLSSAFQCVNIECRKLFRVTTGTIVARSGLSWRNKLQLLFIDLNGDKLTPNQMFMRLDVNAATTAYKYVRKTGGVLRKWRDFPRSNLPERYHTSRTVAARDDLTQIISSAIPIRLPPDAREEIIQEMAVAVLSGEFTVSDIRYRVADFIRAYNRDYGWFDKRSLSELMFDDGGLTLGDTLTGERSFEYWERR